MVIPSRPRPRFDGPSGGVAPPVEAEANGLLRGTEADDPNGRVPSIAAQSGSPAATGEIWTRRASQYNLVSMWTLLTAAKVVKETV